MFRRSRKILTLEQKVKALEMYNMKETDLAQLERHLVCIVTIEHSWIASLTYGI